MSWGQSPLCNRELGQLGPRHASAVSERSSWRVGFSGNAASAEEWCRILRMYRTVGVLLPVALASKDRRRLGWLTMMSAIA